MDKEKAFKFLQISILKKTASANFEILFFPVIVYGLAISLMGGLALYFSRKHQGLAGVVLLLGALIFTFSDALLAINKFQYQHPSYPALIIGSYAVAQWLFVTFMLKSEHTMVTG